jgi:hypothetical protein
VDVGALAPALRGAGLAPAGRSSEALLDAWDFGWLLGVSPCISMAFSSPPSPNARQLPSGRCCPDTFSRPGDVHGP